ncbi:R3H domain-containing protein 4 [Lamellibrachia satsuma]|nr:R3H domain-containing protein 4 [Lamellibrachia satsuma]
MGVSRRRNSFNTHSEDELELIENYVNAPDSRPPTPQVTGGQKRGRQRNSAMYGDSVTCRRKPGVRRSRRQDNLNHLLTLVEEDEDLTPELYEPGLSAFAELLLEEDKMNIWNEFISQSEEQQREYLLKVSKRECAPTGADEPDNRSRLPVEDRVGHPVCAEECFDRIDRNIRGFLRKKHLPMGTLEHLEEEVISFFTSCAKDVFVCRITNSFERLLLHALSQYMDLLSHSYTDEDGTRHTLIENKNEEFHLPDLKLGQYLESFQNKVSYESTILSAET